MSKSKKPEFQLQKVDSYDPNEEPILYAINKFDADWYIDRRRFLKTTSLAIGAIAIESLIFGCSKDENLTDPTVPPGPGEEDLCLWYIEHVAAHHRVRNLTFSPDGEYLATLGERSLKLWKMPSNKLDQVLTTGVGSVGRFVFSSDSKLIAVTYSRKVHLTEISSASVIKTLDPQLSSQYSIEFISFTPDDELLVSANLDGSIKVFSVTTGDIVHQFSTHANNLQSGSLSPDGKTIAIRVRTSAGDQVIQLWDIPSGTLIKTLTVLTTNFGFVLFNPDGNILASLEASSTDYSLKLLEIPSGNILQELDPGSISFTPDGNLAISKDDVIEIRKVPSGELIQSISHCSNESYLAFNPDNSLLAGADGRRSYVNLWEMPSGNFLTGLFDKEAVRINFASDRSSGLGGINYYALPNQNGVEIMYTAPRSVALPDNATCTCNVVGGRVASGGGGPCNPHFICTCVPVWF